MGHDMPDRHRAWVDQLVHRLGAHDWYSVINACYQYRIDYDDPSIYNTLVCYNWAGFDQTVMTEFVANAGQSPTSNRMRTIFGANAFALWSPLSLRKHQMRLVPHVKKWLVVGATWQMCVHDRPLGLINLVREFVPQGHEFYGATWGFCKDDLAICTHEDFETDPKITWQSLGNDLFQAQSIKT